MNTMISGLQSGEGLGPFRTPSGAFDYNGSLYMFYVVEIQEGKPHLALKSIMAKADQSHTKWGNSSPPTFHRLYTVSTHPQVEDVSNPPAEEGGAGKFMFNPVVVLDAATAVECGLDQGPSACPAKGRSSCLSSSVVPLSTTGATYIWLHLTPAT